MALFIILVSVFVLGLCLSEGKYKKGFLGVALALLYFPLGVILALTKKYK